MTDKPRFSMRTIQQETIEGGFTITTTTDVACHLWLRWAVNKPQKHLIPVLRRGLYIHSDAYFCFTSYQDLEQNEEGDTTTHTFTWLGWEECNVRYFYFIGTIADIEAASTTGYFQKHYWPYPKTLYFNPDPDSGAVTVDGSVRRYRAGLNETWSQIRSRDGMEARVTGSYNAFEIVSGVPAERWLSLGRSILTFDTSPIPKDGITLAVKLHIWVSTKQDFLGIAPDISVVLSNPATNNNLIPPDYRYLGTTPLAPPIPYTGIVVTAWNTLTFTEPNFKYIKKEGITRLGLRNINYDAYDVDPAWQSFKNSWIGIESAESAIEKYPTLEVTYSKLKPTGIFD